MPSFPLYDQLVTQNQQRRADLDAAALCRTCRSLSRTSEGLAKAETVWALIHHHAVLNGRAQTNGFDYGAKPQSKTSGVSYAVDNLPQEVLELVDLYLHGQ